MSPMAVTKTSSTVKTLQAARKVATTKTAAKNAASKSAAGAKKTAAKKTTARATGDKNALDVLRLFIKTYENL